MAYFQPHSNEFIACIKKSAEEPTMGEIKTEVEIFFEDESNCDNDCESNNSICFENEDSAFVLKQELNEILHDEVEIKTEILTESTNEAGFQDSATENINKKDIKFKKNLKSPSKKRLACNRCSYTCKGPAHMRKHYLAHSDDKFFACMLCSASFKQKSHLNRHLLIHSGEKPYSCDQCDYRVNNRSSLTRHYSLHTGEKPFTCHQCGRQFVNKTVLNGHLRIHKREKAFVCEHCNYKTNHKWNFQTHQSQHAENEGLFICYNCNFECTKKNVIRNHMLIHIRTKCLSCDQCNYTCATVDLLLEHEKIHSEDSTLSHKAYFECYHCSYRTTRKATLILHLMIHSGRKRYSCDECKYSGKDKFALQRHQWTHSKPFNCDRCEYKCSQKSLLQRHQLTHSVEKQ